MDSDLAEVMRLEVALLTPEVRADLGAVLAMLHPDFLEYGASGRVWDISSVTATLNLGGERPRAQEMHPVRLAPDVVLLTYSSERTDRTSLRSSIWVRDGARGWLLRFHQGTLAAAQLR